jgi:hypothetical protein
MDLVCPPDREHWPVSPGRRGNQDFWGLRLSCRLATGSS